MDDGADGRAVVRASSFAKTKINSVVKDQPAIREEGGVGRVELGEKDRERVAQCLWLMLLLLLLPLLLFSVFVFWLLPHISDAGCWMLAGRHV